MVADSSMLNRFKLMESNAAFDKRDSIRKANLKKMVDGGVTIASGTDAGNIGTMHATSYLEELQAMKSAGLTNWQIIEASTINGAKVLGKEKQFGSISVGKKANLVLLNANPVENLENLRKINLVVNKGVVINPDTLIQESPEDIVSRQLIAFNARNIESFLDSYSDDVELYDFPDKQISKGKADMRKMYAAFFDRMPGLHSEVKEEIVQDNVIICKSVVTAIDRKTLEGITIYHIENNKIKRVYFSP
jgi:hypothetical protein